ncbi:hypothetical protein [Alicyclobacillus fodiniaquatilis]|uniref:Uncharacterized protein n=1 Tax=Alicyclobacillus fodiniaquatilis TaxID=1661150 RepID=A0ABW4JJ70_9BACL
MSCSKCIHYFNGEEGEHVCGQSMIVSNLKSFPFTRVPSQCKSVFDVNPMALPTADRYWSLLSNLCGNACDRCDVESQPEGRNGCSTETCDAFRYLIGRTDLTDDELTAPRIREILQNMRLMYKTNEAGKQEFKMAQWETCSLCQGKDSILPNGDYFDICHKCLGKGETKVGTNENVVYFSKKVKAI